MCVILMSVGCRKIKDSVSLSMMNNKSEIFVNLNIIQCNYKILGTKVCALTYKIIKQSDSFLLKDLRDSIDRPKVGQISQIEWKKSKNDQNFRDLLERKFQSWSSRILIFEITVIFDRFMVVLRSKFVINHIPNHFIFSAFS